MTAHSWRWVSESAVFAIHDEQLAEHGGLAGMRDKSLLLSALAKPQNLEAYGTPDVADLAAAYVIGIMQNHAFLDGNKRTAFVVASVFLLKDGYDLIANDRECMTAMLAVAEGSMPEMELAVWFRGYICLVDDSADEEPG